ncbi:MAG: helix-turn-helix domain-containing protein [Bacteroidota bacterium]
MKKLTLEDKIVNGIERLSDALKALLWQKAKAYGISPIQIQILLFVSKHKTDICNVSYIAREFNVTKATISDAVKVLLKKGLLEKDFSPTDNRRYNLLITEEGKDLVLHLTDYTTPLSDGLSAFSTDDKTHFFDMLSKFIYQLNQKDVIQVQRTCFNCKYYSGNKQGDHYCNLLGTVLKKQEVRLDCDEFEEEVV